jgi:hypothetical protein
VDLFHCRLGWRGEEKKEKKKSENAVKDNSSRGPISHIVSAEIGIFVNFPSFPKGRGRDERNYKGNKTI